MCRARAPDVVRPMLTDAPEDVEVTADAARPVPAVFPGDAAEGAAAAGASTPARTEAARHGRHHPAPSRKRPEDVVHAGDSDGGCAPGRSEDAPFEPVHSPDGL